MTPSEAFEAIGKTVCENSQLESDFAILKSKLAEIGGELVNAGQVLKNDPANFQTDRDIMTKAVDEVWELVAKYRDAGAKLAENKRELERLKSGGQ
jgi:cytochrome c556